MLIFWKNTLSVVTYWLNLEMKMEFLKVYFRKKWRFFPMGPFFLCLSRVVYQSALIPKKFLCPGYVPDGTLGQSTFYQQVPRSQDLLFHLIDSGRMKEWLSFGATCVNVMVKPQTERQKLQKHSTEHFRMLYFNLSLFCHTKKLNTRGL